MSSVTSLQEASTGYALDSWRVLVVDDEQTCRNLLSEVLARAGHKVRTASSGIEALAVLEQFPADLVLTDLAMPGMDGIHLLDSLRQSRPDVEVIIITGHGTIETAVEAMRRGATNFLVKPFRANDILVIVNKSLEARRLRQDRDRLSHTVSLLEMGQTLNRTMDINVLPSKAAEILQRKFDADSVTLVSVDPAHGRCHVLAHAGPLAGHGDDDSVRRALEQARRVAQDGRPRFSGAADPADPSGEGSSLFVPLLLEGRPRGVVGVERAAGRHPFGSEDAQLLQIFASHLTIALENARLFALAGSRIRELEDLDTTTKILSLCTDPEEIRTITLHAALRLTRATACAMLVAAEGSASVKSVPRRLARADLAAAIQARMNSAYAGLAGGLAGRPPPAPDPAQDALFRSFISVPLVTPNGLIGLVAAFSDAADRFSDNDVRLLSAVGNNAAIAIQNVGSFFELKGLYRETIGALAEAIDAKDHYTHGHSDTVRRYSSQVARRLGMPSEDVRRLEDAALLHDIGKISVPEGVLNKPGRLTSEEMDIIRSHAARGAEMLSKAPHLKHLIPIIRHHHEHFDGAGYPDGLHGEQIPVAARICSIADSYDAMTSDRIYRAALSPQRAREILQVESGKQFDPDLVRMFVALLREDEDANAP